jgi:hypothetical protein
MRPAQSRHSLPLAGEHSEWAELSLLRADWTSKSACLAVRYPGGTLDSELVLGRDILWSGPLLPEIHCDGMTLEIQGAWEELCWVSDADLDYLELEVELSHGWRLQRQLVLARRDQFAYLADVVLGPRSARLDYRLELPLVPQISAHEVAEMTEVIWQLKEPRVCAMPLALNEWRCDSRSGRFDGRVIHQVAAAPALYVPLLLDLNSKRLNKPRTWRQLTVAENLMLLPRHVAVAYRVQIGSRQWVVYRSLADTGSRTFLGHNLTSEFLLARFSTDGELNNLIEIE